MDHFPIHPDASFAFVHIDVVREVPTAEMPMVGNSREVFQLAKDFLFREYSAKEAFWALFLNGKHRLIGANLVSVGTMTASLVHPREVFSPAIAIGAHAIILLHNHPSGDPTPSPEDIEITTRLAETGRLVGIRLLDHVIVGEGAFTSCFERGLIRDA